MELSMLRGKITYLIIVLFFLFLPGCGEKIEPGTTEKAKQKVVAAPVAVAATTHQAFVYEAVGNVEARTESTVSSKVMGTVKSVHVREGDTVKTGDLLVEVDKESAEAQLRKAEAGLAEAKRAEESARFALAAAKAGAELTGATYNRFLKLLEEASASRQEFDEIEAKNLQAKASLAQAAAMLEAASYRIAQAKASSESARINIKDADVRAPYDGKVTAKMVDVGDLASSGTPLLKLEKEGVYCVVLVLPEKHIQAVRIGQKATVTIASLQDKKLEGFIGRIDPSADKKSRSFRIRVALPEDRDIRSGMFARVMIPVGEGGMMLVPASAVVRKGQLEGVYLLDDEKRAHFRLIRTGRTFGDSVEVLTGIKDGARYVVKSVPDLADGVRVEGAE